MAKRRAKIADIHKVNAYQSALIMIAANGMKESVGRLLVKTFVKQNLHHQFQVQLRYLQTTHVKMLQVASPMEIK